MGIFDLDTRKLLGLDTVHDLCQYINSGGEYMTRKRYEDSLHELEEKEGKLFTIKEAAEMIGTSIDATKNYITWGKLETFKLRHYKTQSNITLIPVRSVIKLMNRRTPILQALKGLSAAKIDGVVTIEDAIRFLESHQEG